MNRPERLRRVLALLVVTGLAWFALAASPSLADAQMRPATATLTRVTGHVEVLRHGQTTWIPAAVGAQLAERDEIRAFGGGLAVLQIPDGSTLILAENSRMVVTQLELDPQLQTRNAIFHLVVGKVRAVVGHAALTLVRARQSNFSITTPTAVAAARGTDYVTVFNLARQTTTVVVFEEGRHPATPPPPTGEAPPGPDEDVYVVWLGEPPAGARP